MFRRAALVIAGLTLAFPTAAAARGDVAEIGQYPERELALELARIYTPARGNGAAAHAIYVDTARARGWTDEEIERRWPFIDAIIARESDYCPNVRGGDQYGDDCVVTKAGTRSGHYNDAGFGQVNHVHHGRGRNPRAWLCVQEGLCSAEDIIATPQASMTALLAVFERGGKGPWCFSSKLRRTGTCQIPA